MIAVYVDTKDSILLLSKDQSFHALFYIIKQWDSERNIWYCDNTNKKYIMDQINVSNASLAKYIQSLVERKLLIRDGIRGRYKLNLEILSL